MKHSHLYSDCLKEPDPLKYRALKRRPPNYPSKALRKGIKGVVVIEHTIKKNGSVYNPVIIWSSSTDPKNPTIFHTVVLIALRVTQRFL